MIPPIFPVCAASTKVTDLIGDDPVRLYPFGEATQLTERPYVVYQVITGFPENFLDCPPDVDSWSIQVDVYAHTAHEATDVAEAIRDTIQTRSYIVRYGGTTRDPETRDYRVSFDVDWFKFREDS